MARGTAAWGASRAVPLTPPRPAPGARACVCAGYAGWVGGVAHLQEITATFVRCRLTDNQSGSFGAGLQLTWSNVTMEDSEISGVGMPH